MAEVMITMGVGPLLSMVKEKASSYLLDQYKVMEGMEENHKVLKRKLPAILDVIVDAEMEAAKHREGAKAWLEAVREVAYQGNDVFDEFKYEALRRKAKTEGHYHELGMDELFPTCNHVKFRHVMGNKLSMILQDIEVLIAEMNAFRFKFLPQQQLSLKWRQTDPEIIDDSMEIAKKSRAEEKKSVVDTLLAQRNNEDLTVLPIFGMGGLGKTTLAQLVYNDSKIQEHFQLRIWVCVSDNFDVDFLTTRIVQAVTNENRNGPEVLSGKRYLLVLDDVWNRDTNQWKRLKSFLQHGGMGSSVLITTRDKSIVQFMGTTEQPYKLGLLDPSFIEQIIRAKAPSSRYISPVLVLAMASKCVGSPLAATALGSVLSTKNSEEEWKTILNRSTICDEENGILPILKLSYNDLTSHMRQCFAFCAVFPKDHEIDVEMMIQLWIANGFILENQVVCPEIKGKQIFAELASRSFFQDVKHGYWDRSTCKIHDLMHDVALSAMGKECATIAEKSSKKSEDIPYSTICAESCNNSEVIPYFTRHLFVPPRYPKNILNGFLEKSSPGLQTLLCTSGYTDGKVVQILSKDNSIRALKIGGNTSFLKPEYLRHLRYLDISKSSIEALPEDISILYHLQTLNLSGCSKLVRFPKGIKYMTALRHLDLSESPIAALPEDLTILCHLQTLNVSGCGSLVELPKGMKYMTSLRHLYTHGCSGLKMMPQELRCLTSLQTLTYFIVGEQDSSCGGIAVLGPLVDLGGPLEVCQLENVRDRDDALEANLGKKKRVTELTLKWSDNTVPHQNINMVLEDLKPHEGIKVLNVYGYGGSTWPAWMDTLHHLVKLAIHECENIERLPPLWELAALQDLYIRGMRKLRWFCCGRNPPFTFKKIKVLKLDRMPKLETWWDINHVQGQQESMFPVLEKLEIRNCERLIELPRTSMWNRVTCFWKRKIWQPACPTLKVLKLRNLAAFTRWEAPDEILGEHITTFPSLETLFISDCFYLNTLPEIPKLKILMVSGCSEQIVQRVAERYITVLSFLVLRRRGVNGVIELVNTGESSSLEALEVDGGWGFLFRQPTAPLALWSSFVQLKNLFISNCDDIGEWPGNVFERLVSLRLLGISDCSELTQQADAIQRCVLPPRLETLWLGGCQSLVEILSPLPPSLRKLHVIKCVSLVKVPTPLPASLSLLDIYKCDKLMSPVVLRAVDGVGVRQEMSVLRIHVIECSTILSLSVQLGCTKSLIQIKGCRMLKKVDGDVQSSLEVLVLTDCENLKSIPDGPPQVAYSSLRKLIIRNCPRLKVLPPCLKQRLNGIKETDLDHRYTGTRLSRSWNRVMGRQPHH